MSNTSTLRARYEQLSQQNVSNQQQLNNPGSAARGGAPRPGRTGGNFSGAVGTGGGFVPAVNPGAYTNRNGSSYQGGYLTQNGSGVSGSSWKQRQENRDSNKLTTPLVDQDAPRTKPLNKPKIDPTRATVVMNAAALQKQFENLAAAEEEQKRAKAQEETKKKDPNVLEIDPKWRIDYDALEFDDLISEGSAGAVYMGYYFGTPVAIKKLFALAENQKHLVAREFAMLQGVNHPNVVQFLGICDHSSGIYLITEYIENGDLFDLLIFSGQRIDWKTKSKIALQIAQACFYLHSKNIIHRDLKSQNVLIGDGNKIKLCDLGLATVIENSKRMTICGTNEWMAPEIALEDAYDGKADVFSFGIVIVEMIFQKPPPRRKIEERLAFNVDQFRQTIPEDTPEELTELVIECCRFEPSERPSFKEIVPRLRNLVNSLPDPDE